MKRTKFKKLLSLLLTVIMTVSIIPMTSISASAATWYANGKVFPNSTIPSNGSNPFCSCGPTVGSGNHWCCHSYAAAAYNYIWNGTTTASFIYSSANNMLRNLSASERANTAANLKKFFANAPAGAFLRIDSSSSVGTTNYGHSLIFLANNSSGTGGYFLEGNYDGHGRSTISEWNWSNLANYYNYGYNYIAYICWPGAPAYSDAPQTAPTYAKISSDKTSYNVGENICFTCSADGITNTVWIYYPDGSSKYYENIGNSFNFSLSTPGKYYALVQTWNNLGNAISGKIIFTVGSPTYAKILSDKVLYDVGENILFTCNADGLTNTVWIYYPDGSSKYYQNIGSTFKTSLLMQGKYYALVQTWNGIGSKMSEKISFVVGKEFNISYNANGGADAPIGQIKTIGTDLILSDQIPIRYGYTFLGWSEDKNATSPTYLSGGTFTEDEDTVLYAIWGICNHAYGKTIISYSDVHPHYAIYKCNNCDYTFSGTETEKNSICPECIFTITALNETDCKITGYTGGAGEMVIPSKIGNLNSYSTDTGAFKNNVGLTSVIIDEGITEIGGLAFMGCSNLKKAVIPASVTKIGAFPFYDCSDELVIYCYPGSEAYNYAVANSIDYVLMTVKATDKTKVNFEKNIIFTTGFGNNTLAPIITPIGDVVLVPMASKTIGATEIYGTGTEVNAFYNNTLVADYTVIVCGDLNGDGVCDVLDAMEAEGFSQNRQTPMRNQIYAANSAISDDITAESYQNVVNIALS